jgi:threonylcarbamoyladenosine tRNA methylthiotransferase MtaB
VKLYLRTFGCRANQYDSEAVRAMAADAGVEVVSHPAAADVALFNSCAVTADAEADLRQQVRRAARENPALRTVIMGCAAALPDRGGARSLRSLPTVQGTVAGADLVALAAELGLPPASARARAAHQTGARALLRIQDGCNEHCTFCATTIARGASRSRPVDALLSEAATLAQHHPEIVLTGVHIGGYGTDAGSSLGALLERLVREVPEVRFRLSSLEATEVDDRLAELLTGAPRRVAPYLHAPLQSGSDRLLRRMGRHWYTAAAYAASVERLAARSAVFGLGADLIAGFPGETDDDHAATLALVASLPFTGLHVFPYSPRPGTAAERLAGTVPSAVARRRAADLRALGARLAGRYRQARAGHAADVVVVRGGGEREGLTEDYLSVQPDDPWAARGTRFDAVLRLDGDAMRAAPRADHAPPTAGR